MSGTEKFLQNIKQGSGSLAELLRNVDALYTSPDLSCDGCYPAEKISAYCLETGSIMDLPLLSQLEQLSLRPDVAVSVRPDLRSLRITLRDDEDRLHSATLDIRGERYLIIDTSVPHAAYQNSEYADLVSAVEAFRANIASLQGYFRELERIDARCWVVDPQRPTFKDDYRRIVLEERAWLHVEVSPEGGAARLRVAGGGAPAAAWSARLSARLHEWRPERDVLHNAMCILEIDEFPQPPDEAPGAAALECAICLCAELPGARSCPQPLCARAKCGSYYHTSCLFQWLVASAGGAAPRLGVVSGKCPNCLAPISCSEHDA